MFKLIKNDKKARRGTFVILLNKIGALFQGRVKYNTLILGILPLLFLLELVLSSFSDQMPFAFSVIILRVFSVVRQLLFF